MFIAKLYSIIITLQKQNIIDSKTNARYNIFIGLNILYSINYRQELDMFKRYGNHVKERILNDRATSVVMAVFSLLCVLSGIYWMIDFSLRNLIVSFVFIGFVFFIYWVEHMVNIRFGTLFVAASLTLAFGGILGACFDFYMLIPFFDDILHCLSGVLFACLGYGVAEKFFGKASDKRSFRGCLLFGLFFSLAVAVGWELFEYAGNVFMSGDNFEDTFVDRICSYVLSGGHNTPVIIEDIEKTLIYYGDGQIYEIEGYLDLGSIDTVVDLLVCTLGAVLLYIISEISYKYCPKINKILLPTRAAEDITSESALVIEHDELQTKTPENAN